MAANSLSRGERNIQWIETFCRIPEGKYVGQAVNLSQFQKDVIIGIYDTPTRRGIISFGRKNAKALALDTPIPTIDGWKTINDIQPGNYVFDKNGKPVKVLAVSDVFNDKDCYQLTFSDGEKITASGDHLWETEHRYRPWAKARVNGSGNGGRKRKAVISTENIHESLYVNRPDGRKEHNHKLQIADQLQINAVKPVINPYLLGVWLGDGDSNWSRLHVGENDVHQMLKNLHEYANLTGLEVTYSDKCPTIALNKAFEKGEFKSSLKDYNLINNKHIPNCYFDSSLMNRWLLLQGLMDTDGTVNRHNNKTTARCSFTNKSEQLSYDVWRLVRSLGIKATIREFKAKVNDKDCGLCYEVSFSASLDQQIFRFERKQKLLPRKLAKRSNTLTIIDCKRIETVKTKCLMVDSEDSLFLAGHGCIPTHNTTLASWLLLLHLVGPEAKPNSQLYSAAQSRDQAGILFNLAAKTVRMSPDLMQYVSIKETAKELITSELGTRYKALSADAATSYGLSPVFLVHDELGQVKGPRSELYEALETACAAQESPLSIIISTQAPTDADLLSVLIDDAKSGADKKTKLFLYTADDKIDAFSEKAIRQANPAFDDFMNKDEVLSQAESAKRMPSRENAYRNLVLNQRVSAHSPFISRKVWMENEGDVNYDLFNQVPIYMGLDLSSKNDLTALAKIAQDAQGRWHVDVEFFAPAHGVEERSKRDRVPYDVWADMGLITLTPGASVDYETIADRLLDIQEQSIISIIAFDRWRMDVLEKELSRIGLDLPLEPHGQGYKDMAPAVDELESALLNQKLVHDGNPVLTWCAANAVVIKDPAGNRKLDKVKSTGRIDGIIALLMALSKAVSHTGDEGSFDDWLSEAIQ